MLCYIISDIKLSLSNILDIMLFKNASKLKKKKKKKKKKRSENSQHSQTINKEAKTYIIFYHVYVKTNSSYQNVSIKMKMSEGIQFSFPILDLYTTDKVYHQHLNMHTFTFHDKVQSLSYLTLIWFKHLEK